MTHLDGDYKSLTHKGIYSLETESLKICITKTDKRPKGFMAKTEYGQALYVMKREKP